MTKDLDLFYKYTKVVNKEFAEYKDDEGNYTLLPVSALLLSVDYNELNKQQFEIAKFNQDIPKDCITKIKKTKKAISKFDLTHKEEDRYILVEKEEDVHQVWFAINQLKIKKCFLTKEEAIKYAEDINNKILKKLEVI